MNVEKMNKTNTTTVASNYTNGRRKQLHLTNRKLMGG